MPLFCQNCGQGHTAYVSVCPQCGQNQPLPPSADATNVRAADRTEELRGVGGWLLLFCISLAVISPVTQGLIAAKALRNLATARLLIPDLLRLAFTGVIYGGLATFSCVAGIMLWSEKPRAVTTAKAYLVVAAVLPISLFAALYLAGMNVNLATVIFRRTIYSVVWFSYLAASRRVKLTYRLH